MKEFKHLDFPRLREYYTKYPQGYTLYESLLDILERINEMTDVVNLTLNQWEQIETWVLTELQNYSMEQLQTLLDNGTLEEVINDALFNSKADKTELISLETRLKGEINKKADVSYVDNKVAGLVSGSPLAVSLVSQMVDNNRNYVYTGSEEGYVSGNWYYYNGSDWVSGGIYQSTGISPNSINLDKVTFKQLYKNLFNKNTSLIGYYVDHTTGTIQPVPTYTASDYIPVSGNTYYTKNKPHQLAFYDINKNYISGLPDENYTFLTPSNCVYIRATVLEVDLDSYQLEKGQEQTNYDSYREVLDITSIPRLNNEYTVGKAGANFSSIIDGIYYLDTVVKPIEDITMKVSAGTYDEVITLLKGDKKIALIGSNKRDCIVVNRTGDYYQSPLQIAGRTYIANMSFISNHDDVQTIPNPSGYAVHSDYNYSGEMVFENCSFKSYQNASVGIGTFHNQTMIFRNCQFYSDSIYDGGALYFHNAVDSGVTLQKLVFINCEIISERGHALKMDDANIGSGDGLGNDLEVTFINCLVYSKTLGKDCIDINTPPLAPKNLVGNVKLSPLSYGNNLEELNY